MAILHAVPGKSELIGRLGRALGIDFPFSRLVIEMDVNSYVKLYVVAPADVTGMKKVCELVESIEVKPDATIEYVPRRPT